MHDWELIERYAQSSSEEAFAELVRRYVNLVYSATSRAVDGDASLAEEATQKTFCLLARKSASLSQRTVIVGWLYKTACNIGRDVARAERRRRFYEQKAALMSADSAAVETDHWEEIAPHLEPAMETLSETDRVVILMRYFQQKSMRDVGEVLGVSEDATKMRVSRALGRLREQFAKRGVKTTTAALAAVLAAESVHAAPAALTNSLIESVASFSATAPLPTTIGRIIAMSALKKVAVGIALLAIALSITTVRKIFKSPIQSAATTLPAASKAPVKSATVAKAALSLSPVELSAAAANLRQALNTPWGSRRVPRDRVEAALAQFGRDRSQALPILMEVLNTPRGERSFEAFILAAYGIEVLGPEAMVAWPELRSLMNRGDFAALNNPRFFASLSPDGQIIPDLIDALQNARIGRDVIGLGIDQIINQNPTLLGTYLDQIAELLRDPSEDVRRQAAYVLARLPGAKYTDALPTLVDALKIEKLRDPHAYDPIVNKEENSTTLRDGERFDDESTRLSAIAALREFGPAAEAAAPTLLEIASLTPPTNSIHDLALIAAKTIAPTIELPETDAEISRRAHVAELIDHATNGAASFDELLECLRYPESVEAAAYALKSFGERARPALPALLAAIDLSDKGAGGYDAAQRVKELAPDALIDRLAADNLKGLPEVAEALGELGPSMSNALPHLERIFNQLGANPDDPISAVAKAIQQINPNAPKQIFEFNDLHDASTALLKAIYDNDKIRSPVYTAYIRDFSDHNMKSRPQLIRFANATKADAELHDVFVKALVGKNPSLGPDLMQ